MGRAARTKTSGAAVKHTLKHARSPEGLVVGIEAPASTRRRATTRTPGRAASLSSSVDAAARAASGLGSGLGSGMHTRRTTAASGARAGPRSPWGPTTPEYEFPSTASASSGDWAAPRRAGARAVGLARLEGRGWP